MRVRNTVQNCEHSVFTDQVHWEQQRGGVQRVSQRCMRRLARPGTDPWIEQLGVLGGGRRYLTVFPRERGVCHR
ncbi:uncharacterized protein MONOS_17716 [Monocercomonoides exilis]|uniref:uncharacterized protein n=1 Tax=Monocercomonoides exilis TaxID=2049356 RepID=UPI003559D6BA|nr:hypothetical protein MONOS_18186 [Monocercomonoides exilis]KAH7821676.1 hypothetical protein MONOS_17716 [Monocercomonoides exilis]